MLGAVPQGHFFWAEYLQSIVGFAYNILEFL